MKKTVEHTHVSKGYSVWADAELLAHVQAQHDLTDKPYLLNESNRTLLVQQHEQAHHGDPIQV
jgi:hypothetical protein